MPESNERLKSFIIAGAILVAVDCSILAEMPSGPLALLGSTDWSNVRTWSTVHSHSSGTGRSTPAMVPKWWSRGGDNVLKQDLVLPWH